MLTGLSEPNFVSKFPILRLYDEIRKNWTCTLKQKPISFSLQSSVHFLSEMGQNFAAHILKIFSSNVYEGFKLQTLISRLGTNEEKKEVNYDWLLWWQLNGWMPAGIGSRFLQQFLLFVLTASAQRSSEMVLRNFAVKCFIWQMMDPAEYWLWMSNWKDQNLVVIGMAVHTGYIHNSFLIQIARSIILCRSFDSWFWLCWVETRALLCLQVAVCLVHLLISPNLL